MTTRTPLIKFEKEIAEKVIGPKIIEVYSSTPGIDTRDKLLQAFRDRFECNVSRETFAKWLTLAGIEIDNVFLVKSPYEIDHKITTPATEGTALDEGSAPNEVILLQKFLGDRAKVTQ